MNLVIEGKLDESQQGCPAVLLATKHLAYGRRGVLMLRSTLPVARGL